MVLSSVDSLGNSMEWIVPVGDDYAPHLSLADQIQHSFATSTFDGLERQYLPQNARTTLITQLAIEEELRKGQLKIPRCTDEQRQLLVDWIYLHAPKTFVTSLLCGFASDNLLMAMGRFWTFRFTDSNLPISKPDLPTSVPVPTGSNVFRDTPIWNYSMQRRFYTEQDICSAPVFSPEDYDYNLSPTCILPFKQVGSVASKGAFSVVRMVEIHPEHHGYSGVQHVNNITTSQRNMLTALVRDQKDLYRTLRRSQRNRGSLEQGSQGLEGH